jgi:hypothetical protein
MACDSAAVMVALGACGSSGSKSAPTSATTAVPVLTTSAPVSKSSASSRQPQGVSVQKKWCGLALGDSKDAVMSTMGTPKGHKADNYRSLLGAGMTFAEWDVGSDVFLVTFTDGRATNLQAYDQEIGPVGARDISCQPFRHP